MKLIAYTPGYTTIIADGWTVRKEPTTKDSTAIRVTKGTETWTLLGSAEGELASGSKAWFVRVVGTSFEYVHSKAGTTPIKPAPCLSLAELESAKVKAAVAAVANFKTKVAAL